jgi:hypothetical protein
MKSTSPYEPPKSTLIDTQQGDISRNCRYVIVRPESEWPKRCFKCNEETDNTKELTLTYINPWIYVSILINILITIILALIFRKRFPVKLPLCEVHQRKYKNLLIFQWAMLGVIFSGVIAGLYTEEPMYFFAAMVAFFPLIISSLFGRLAHASRYRDDVLWVKGAGKEFLNSLSDSDA